MKVAIVRLGIDIDSCAVEPVQLRICTNGAGELVADGASGERDNREVLSGVDEILLLFRGLIPNEVINTYNECQLASVGRPDEWAMDCVKVLVTVRGLGRTETLSDRALLAGAIRSINRSLVEMQTVVLRRWPREVHDRADVGESAAVRRPGEVKTHVALQDSAGTNVENDVICDRRVVLARDAQAGGVDPFDGAVAARAFELVGGNFVDTSKLPAGVYADDVKGKDAVRADELHEAVDDCLFVRRDDRLIDCSATGVVRGLKCWVEETTGDIGNYGPQINANQRR